ncbi:hypothetical protein I7I48_07266 [Histoplasma ohiense]|nr:hypothetical protein I7I48_07266 [Histoplasma ohiense (nom. inval.)]
MGQHLFIYLTGPLTISANSECATSAAASAVDSPAVSYIGATSTTSAPTTWTSVSASASRMVRSSRVLNPPGSGVPVASVGTISSRFKSTLAICRAERKNLIRTRKPAYIPGANAGSNTSISTLIYALLFPTRFLIFSTMPLVPMRSMSRAVMMSNPHRISFFMSFLGRTTGPRIPT